MLRYSKLSDPQVLANLLVVCDKEHISYSDDGMEAIVFTAQGNLGMLNNSAPLHIILKLKSDGEAFL